MTPGPRDPFRTLNGSLTVKVNGGPTGQLVPGSPQLPGSGSGGSVSPGNSGTTGLSSQTTRITPLDHSRDQSSHLTDLSQLSHLSPIGEVSRVTKLSPSQSVVFRPRKWTCLGRISKNVLATLTLLCILSLLMAVLCLVFLVQVKVEPQSRFWSDGEMTVQEVTLALAALALSLDLCCLLVCSSQLIFALKLMKTQRGEERLQKYMQQLSTPRICAVGGFFASIPVLLTAVVVLGFGRSGQTAAILTAAAIVTGILGAGAALVHNVHVWNKERDNSRGKTASFSSKGVAHRPRGPGTLNSSPLPNATLDLSRASHVGHLELSTLV